MYTLMCLQYFTFEQSLYQNDNHLVKFWWNYGRKVERDGHSTLQAN
jgi:hypothetical protein